MVRHELLEAFEKRLIIQHKKGGRYVIISHGEVQIDGIWIECFTYQENNGGIRNFTRTVDDFANFKVV